VSTDLVPFDQLRQMGAALASSGLFGMKSEQQAIALMLVAQAEGLHPATIAQDYDIIQGRAARKSHSVLARFQAAGGHVRWLTLTDTKAEATFSHPQGDSVTLDWTIEMAKRAGLVGKDNWKNYPRAMLRARCIAEGVRATYPAALGGAMLVEEAADLPPAAIGSIDNETGQIIEPPAPRGPQRKSAATPAPKPEEEAHEAEASPPPKEPLPKPAATAAAGVISTGQVAYLRNKMKAAGVDEATVIARFQLANLEAMSVEQFDEMKAELLQMA
jgi:hypothetical protein